VYLKQELEARGVGIGSKGAKNMVEVLKGKHRPIYRR